ncbi:MAG TPA: alpha-hydroxy acid oxidase [Steroidobacteraceae bacterium]
MTVITSIADLRALARRRLPRVMFDYADRGSYDEITLRRNRHDFEGIELRQRVMVDMSSLSLATTVLGERWAIPVGIGPVGLAGMFHRDGEICAARAAAHFGVPFCLSTMSICSIEDVRAAVRTPFWFQLYLMRDRGVNADLIARAQAAQCSALMLTLDTQLHGVRRQDVKNGLSIPPRLTLRNALSFAAKPAWALGILRGRRRTFGNLEGRVPRSGSLSTLAQWIGTQFDRSLNWTDVAWVRSRWPGKLILKGILDAADARLACDAGADAIVVSNHGGRQLDGAPSTISMLPEVAAAAQSRCEVLLDGGVQSGQDILKALALGANACLIGKAFVYGLGARGEAGVRLALELLRQELEVTLGLTGRTDVRLVDAGVLRGPPSVAQGARS